MIFSEIWKILYEEYDKIDERIKERIRDFFASLSPEDLEKFLQEEPYAKRFFKRLAREIREDFLRDIESLLEEIKREPLFLNLMQPS